MSQKLVCLALQGGGSHGAYTWGVLDRLLEHDDIAIEAISGASAGAVNATVLAYGHLVGGREGARAALQRFWSAVSEKTLAGAAGSAFPQPATRAYLSLTRYFSPYQLNPLNLNPLRDIVVVVLTPPGPHAAPSSAEAILERFTQIAFSSTLATELHSIALAKAVADRALFNLGRVERRLKALRLHLLDSASYMATLDPVTRFKTDSAFMAELRSQGRLRAEEWLLSNRKLIRPAPPFKITPDNAEFESERNAHGEREQPQHEQPYSDCR